MSATLNSEFNRGVDFGHERGFELGRKDALREIRDRGDVLVSRELLDQAAAIIEANVYRQDGRDVVAKIGIVLTAGMDPPGYSGGIAELGYEGDG